MPFKPKQKSVKQAAVEVLRDAGEPLKAGEIGRRVMKKKGVHLTGKTPLRTVAGILSTETKKGVVFERVAFGTYALREQEAGTGRASRTRRPAGPTG